MIVGGALLIHANISFRFSPRLGAASLATMLSRLMCFGVRAVVVLSGVPHFVVQGCLPPTMLKC